MKNLVGKYYELLNIDSSILDRIKINYVREETEKAETHQDGSFSPSHTFLLLSENGNVWYHYYGNNYDRITS